MPTLTTQAGESDSTGRGTTSNILVLFVIAAGVCLRLVYAAETYLNPDEAYHFFLANRSSLSAVYRATLGSAHPPLLIVLLYYVRQISSSEVVLRMPSVIAGGLFCWYTFQWIDSFGHRTAAMFGLIFSALTPSLVLLGAEIRQYSLLLWFTTASLYYLERAFGKISDRAILLSAVFEIFAVVTHYSALLFAAVIGIYGLWCVLSVRRRSLWTAWLAGQVAVAAVIATLYLSHIRKLSGAGAPAAIAATYLESALFDSRRTNFLSFGARATFRLLHYVFAQPIVAGFVLVLCGMGIVSLSMGRWALIDRRSRGLALLIILALLVNYGAALSRRYPYGGTRHCIWLAVFVIAAASIGGTSVRISRSGQLLTGALLMLLCYVVPRPLGPFIRPANQHRSLMISAETYILHAASADSPFLLDHQSNYVFRYYFCRDEVIDFEIPAPGFVTFPCAGYKTTAPTADSWMFTAQTLPGAIDSARQAFQVPAAQGVWFFQSGWAVDTEPGLRDEMRTLGCSRPATFGSNIVVCKIVPGLSR